MKSNRWTIENSLYALALLLALAIRLVALKATALNDVEASWALQALGLARGQAVTIGPQPLYVLFTGLLMSILGSDNFVARLLPALAGSLIVLFPLLLRGFFGKRASLLMAFGLALDPAMVYLSRTAGSQAAVWIFGLLALGAVYLRRPAWAGVFAALALLGGPQVMAGWLGLVLAWAAGELMVRAEILQPLDLEGRREAPAEGHPVRLGLFFLVGTLLVAGTLFFRFPQGLGALADVLTAYLSGWTTASGVPALRLPAAWIVYQPLVFIFGLVGIVRAWIGRHPLYNRMRWLSLWAFFALVVAMLYPDRQVSDLAWALIPLWALAAMEIASDAFPEWGQESMRISLGQAAMIFILLVFAWLSLAGLTHFTGDLLQVGIRSAALLVVGAGAMAAVATLLVALGWNWKVARLGLAWGLALSFGLYTLAGAWGSAGLSARGGYELWSTAPAVGQADNLTTTVDDLSEWNTGQNYSLSILSLVNSPSLKWTLRNWPDITYSSQLPAGSQPDIVITTKDQSDLSIAQSYRGEEFAWESSASWQGILPQDLPAWLVFREAPAQTSAIILWARTSLFPGGVTTPGLDVPNTNPAP